MKKRSFRSTFVSVILVITVAISIVNLAVYGINIKKIRQVEVLKMKTAGERIDDMITISLNNIKGLKQICCTDNYARNILLKNNEKNDIGTKFENQNYMDNALKHIASMDTLILRATIVNKYGNIYCTDTSIPEEYVKTIRNMTKEWMLFEGKEDEYYYGGLQGDNANILTFLYPLHTYGNTPIALLAVDINYIFQGRFGLYQPPWLTSEKWAMPSVIIMSIWKSLGFNAVILLAGVQGISSEIYESADIDGANVVQKFFKITMPLLKPTIVFVTIISMINSFQAFDQIYVMTKGGPGTATQVVSYLIYMNAFQYFKQGYASAMAYILFIIVFIASIVQLRFSEKNSI